MKNHYSEKIFTQETTPANAAAYQPEFELLLSSARTAPDAARIEALIANGVDWRTLLDLATHHGVRPLVYRSLRAVCWNQIPAETQTEWQEAYQSLTGKNLFVTGELLRITAELQASGISVAVLKGAVIAEIAYGDFSLREFNDLDLLIREADFSRTVDLLQRLGYAPFWKCENTRVLHFLRHIGEYKLVGKHFMMDIDLHWKIAPKTLALSPSVSDFPSGFQFVSLAGASVQSLAPQDLPLYLAAQGGGDQWGDLRRICDLAEFVRKYPNIEWEQSLETARRLGGLRSMLTGFSLASRLLGAELPESVTRWIQNDTVVHRLVERTIRNLQQKQLSGEAVSRYSFQIKAKQGLRGKVALACSILMDRTAEDGSWIMLPRPLWWLYGLLRPLRMSQKLLRRAPSRNR